LTILADLKARRGRYAEAKALYEQAQDVIEGMLISVAEPYWNSSIAATMSQTRDMQVSVGKTRNGIIRVGRESSAVPSYNCIGANDVQTMASTGHHRDNRTHKSLSERWRGKRVGAFFWRTVSW
jgi:hypothetical protein